MRPFALRPRFTLIEMLVVVAIIGILASLLAPSLQKALGQARTVNCVSNLRQVGIAVTSYMDDWRGYFPTSLYAQYVQFHYDNGTVLGPDNHRSPLLFLAYGDYIDGYRKEDDCRAVKVTACPETLRNKCNADGYWLVGSSYSNALWWNGGTYGANRHLARTLQGNPSREEDLRMKPLSGMRRPSQRFLFSDGDSEKRIIGCCESTEDALCFYWGHNEGAAVPMLFADFHAKVFNHGAIPMTHDPWATRFTEPGRDTTLESPW